MIWMMIVFLVLTALVILVHICIVVRGNVLNVNPASGRDDSAEFRLHQKAGLLPDKKGNKRILPWGGVADVIILGFPALKIKRKE